jgi:hypothetical protein
MSKDKAMEVISDFVQFWVDVSHVLRFDPPTYVEAVKAVFAKEDCR